MLSTRVSLYHIASRKPQAISRKSQVTGQKPLSVQTHVHGLVHFTTLDNLPGDFDIVVIKVRLDLVLVDGMDDWIGYQRGHFRGRGGF